MQATHPTVPEPQTAVQVASEDGARLGTCDIVTAVDRRSRNSVTSSSAYSQPEDCTPWTAFVSRTLSVRRTEWDRWASDTGGVSIDMRFGGSTMRRSSLTGLSVAEKAKRGNQSVLGLPIISPYNRLYHCWGFLILALDLTYAAFIVPIGVGFSISNTTWTWIAVCDFTAGLCYTTDMLLSLHVGFVVTYNLQKKVVMKGTQIARFYLTSGPAVLDALSVIPFFAQVVLIIAAAHGHTNGGVEHALQLLRLLRLIRLTHLIKRVFMESIGGAVHPVHVGSVCVLSSTSAYIGQIIYAMLLVINVLGCLWYWTAATEGLDGTWVSRYAAFISEYGDAEGLLSGDLIREHISKPKLYLVSIYWALTTVATVGYGDIVPSTTAELCIAICVFIVGILFFGILLGSIADMLQRASKRARRAALFREKMAAVEAWLRLRAFPKSLRNSIRTYYAEVWIRQAQEGDEETFFADLPHALRHDAVWHLVSRALNTVPLFRDLDGSLQVQLVSKMRPKRELPGREICNQGDIASRLWLLTEGQVVVLAGGEEGQFEADPAVLGETALLQDVNPKSRQYLLGFRTVQSCMLWEMDAREVLGLLQQHEDAYQHACEAVRQQHFRRMAACPVPWSVSLNTFLQDPKGNAQSAAQQQRHSSTADSIDVVAAAGTCPRLNDDRHSELGIGLESAPLPGTKGEDAEGNNVHEGQTGVATNEAIMQAVLALQQQVVKLQQHQHQQWPVH